MNRAHATLAAITSGDLSVTPGTRLGVHEVTAPLGEGGTGQVWRATDTTPGRQVAIKILPNAFAADPERRRWRPIGLENVQSFPRPGSKWQISTDGGEPPQWRSDSKELFYLSPTADNQFMAVDILSQPADAVFKAGVPKKLFVVNVVTGAVPGGQSFQRNSYEVLKDGQRLLLNSSRAALALEVRPSITVVLNWAAGLGK